MPTQFSPSPARAVRASRTIPCPNANADWRCTGCGKLLGVRHDGRLHVRFAGGHEYFACLPAEAICRRCGTLNQATASAR